MAPPRSTSCFLSDDENAVARLVKACERREPSSEPLIERQLVPFFESAAEERQAMNLVRRKSASYSGHKNGRSGSPPTMSPNGSRPVKMAKGQVSSNSVLQGTTRSALRIAPEMKSTPGKPVAVYHTHTQQAACPAIFKSPKPSDLPMPSKAFLCRLGTVDVPMILNIMPAVMPITAAA